RYDSTGAFVDEFVPFRRGGLRNPRDLVLHDGLWYVASSGSGAILRYDASGNFVDVFATIGRPYSLAFHPIDHQLYAVSLDINGVEEFDAGTGALVRTVVPSGSSGLGAAVFLFFLP